MQFTQIPPDYAPLGRPIVYAFSDTAPRTFDVSVIDYGIDDAVGSKRLAGTAAGTLDIAPYLRHRLTFRPSTGPTGFAEAPDRTVLAALEIDGVRSPGRMFLPCKTAVQAPAHLTSVPWNRLIPRGECDEATLLTDTPCTATVEAFRDGKTRTTTYTAGRTGLLLFRLNTADFPDADVLTVWFDRFTRIVYELTPPLNEGCRLAWRSSAGSVEQYTFPVVKEERVETEKERITTESGTFAREIRTSHLLTLLSAYEPTRMLQALTGILSSPQVWRVENGLYLPVEVLTDAAGIRRHGTLRNLELQIRIRKP